MWLDKKDTGEEADVVVEQCCELSGEGKEIEMEGVEKRRRKQRKI